MRDTGGRSSQEPSPNFTYPGPIAQAKEVDPRDLYFNQDSQKKPQSTEPYRLSDVTRSADLDPIHQVKTIHLPPSAIYNTLYAPERENGAIYNLPMCTYQGSFNAPGPSRMYRYLAPKPYVTPYSPRIAGARLNPPIDPAPVNLNVLAPLTTNHPPLVNYENPYTAGKGDMAMFNPPMYTNRRNFSAPGSSTMHRGLPAYGSTFCTPQKGNHQSVFNPQTYTYGSHIPGPSTMYSPPAPGPYIHSPTGHPVRDYYNTFYPQIDNSNPAGDPQTFTHQGGINQPAYAAIYRSPPVLDGHPHGPPKEIGEEPSVPLRCESSLDPNPPAPPSVYPSPPAPLNGSYTSQTSDNEPIIDPPNDTDHKSPNIKGERSPPQSPVIRIKRKYTRRKPYESPSDLKPNIKSEPSSPAPNSPIIKTKRKYLQRKAKVQCEMRLKAIKEESLSPPSEEESLSPPLKEENTSLAGVHMEEKKCVYSGPYSCFIEGGKENGNVERGCKEHGIGEGLGLYGEWLKDVMRGEEDVEKLKVEGWNGEDHCVENEYTLEDWLDLEVVQRGDF